MTDSHLASLENRFDAVLARLKAVEDELEEKDQTIDEQAQRIQELEQTIEKLDDRTDLLQSIRRGSATGKEEKIAVLVQRLVNEAWRRKQKPNNEPARASVDAEGAVDTLQGRIDRTSVYGETGLFKRAVEMVGDEDVLYYVSESRASSKNSRLVLNLEAGDVPAQVAGHEIDQPGAMAGD